MITTLLQISPEIAVAPDNVLDLSDYRDIATIVGVIVAVATLIRELVEYAHQGKQILVARGIFRLDMRICQCAGRQNLHW